MGWRRLVTIAAALVLVAAAVAWTLADGGAKEAGADLVAGRAGEWAAGLRLERPGDVPPGTGVVVTPKGYVLPLLGQTAEAFVVRTPCAATAEVARAAPVPPGAVVLDPGHGGEEPGAIGPNGLTEAELNLEVARHAATALAAQGIDVVLTRTADYSMAIPTRVELAESGAAALVVSVHHNAGARTPSSTPGTEVYHQRDSAESRRLGGLIYDEVRAALAVHAVDWRTFGVGVTWRTNGRDSDFFGMVRGPSSPAVLAELAFLDNPAEADLLARPEVQRSEGEALARAIVRHMTTDAEGSGYVEGRLMGPSGGGGGPGICTDPAEL